MIIYLPLIYHGVLVMPDAKKLIPNLLIWSPDLIFDEERVMGAQLDVNNGNVKIKLFAKYQTDPK